MRVCRLGVGTAGFGPQPTIRPAANQRLSRDNPTYDVTRRLGRFEVGRDSASFTRRSCSGPFLVHVRERQLFGDVRYRPAVLCGRSMPFRCREMC